MRGVAELPSLPTVFMGPNFHWVDAQRALCFASAEEAQAYAASTPYGEMVIVEELP